MKIVCARVDGKDQRMPVGCSVRQCTRCDHPVWLSPSSKAMIAKQPTETWTLVCMQCVPMSEIVGKEPGLPPGQRDELREVGIDPDEAERALTSLVGPLKHEK